MEHKTTPYREPEIFKTAAPKLKKKRYPRIHAVICAVAIVAFIAISIYNLATKSEFISNGGLPGVLFAVEQIATLCLLLFSGFLLIKKIWHFVWPFLGAFGVSIIIEAILFLLMPPKNPLDLNILIPYGIGVLVFLLMFPLMGSLSDKLKLYVAHPEIYES